MPVNDGVLGENGESDRDDRAQQEPGRSEHEIAPAYVAVSIHRLNLPVVACLEPTAG
jgi:hypothetical protein